MKKCLLTASTVLFAFILFFLPGRLQAQLLGTQDFTNATVGSSIFDSPTSWSANTANSTTNPATLTIANTNPLTYPGYNGGGGNYVSVTTAPSGTKNAGYVFTPLSGSTNTYYYSFLINVTSLPAGTAAPNSNYFLVLNQSITATTYFSRLFMQNATGGGYNLGVSKASATGIYSATPKTLSFGTTYLVIIRYTYGSTSTTDDKMYMWVNPVITSEPDVATAEASDANGLNNDGGAITGSAVLDFRVNTLTAAFNIDGFRISGAATSADAFTALAPSNASAATPTLTATPTALDFGTTQTVGTTSASKTFTLSGANLTAGASLTTAAPYAISTDGTTFSTSATFTATQLAAATPPTVYVQYKPTSATASTGSVAITSTGATQVNVALTGTGVAPTPVLTATPTSLDFGTTQTVGTTSASKTFTLSGANLTAGASLNTAAPYAISTDGTTFGTSATFTAAQLAAATPPTVYVQYKPTTATASTGSVAITSTGATQVNVALTGTGVAPTPVLTATPTALDFGTTQTVGTTSASKTFTLSGANLTAGASLTTAAPYAISTDGTTFGTSATFTAAQLAAATPPTVYVQYKPTSATASTGSVAITSTGATQVNVALTGTAVAPTPTLSANPTSLDFGTTQTVSTTSASKTFALTATNLTAGGTIAVAAPFMVSTDGTNFSNNITFLTGAAPATVYVQFTPTNTTAATGTVLVNSTGATQLSVPLTGTGAAAPVASLSATQTTLAFGNVNTGATAVLTYGLSGANLGTNNTIVTTAAPYSVSKDGTTYSVSLSYTPAEIAANPTVSVKYSPTTTGASTGTVTNTNASVTSGPTVNLTGTGVVAALAVTPTSLDFGTTQTVGSASASKTFTVSGTNLTASGTLLTAAPFAISADNINFSTSVTFTAAQLMATTAPTVYVQFTPTGTTAASGSVTVNSTGATQQTVTLTGTGVAATSTITATGTLIALSTPAGTASPNTSFSVSGANMTAGILVTPPAGFEVSTVATSGFTSSLTVGAAGTIAATTVYVRLAAADAVGSYSGNIALTSTGAAEVDVPTITSSVTIPPVLAWDFNGGLGNETTVAAGTVNTNLNNSSITRGATLTAAALSNGFSSTNFVVVTGGSTLSDAVTNNNYLQITVNAKAGFNTSLSTLDANFRRSASGPNAFQWQYSLDGFTTSSNIGSPISYTLSGTNGDPQTQINLSGISALQNVGPNTTVTFRLYGYGATSTGGTFALGRPTSPANDLAIGGTVTAIPPTLAANPTSLDFGTTQTVGTTSASKTFTLTSANLTAGGTVATAVPFTVSTDGTNFSNSIPFLTGAAPATIYVRFTPTNTTAATGAVTVNSTGATQLSVPLTGTGVAVPVASLSTTVTSLSFGNVNTGSSSVLTYGLSGANLGTNNTTVATAAPYTVSKDGVTYSASISYTPTEIAANPSVSVKYSPTATGAAPGSVTNTNTAVTTGPTVSLTGTGVVATLAANPTSLDFGTAQVINTTSAAKTFSLSASNLTGSATLTTAAPYSISTDGTNFSTTVTITAAALATAQNISVKFSPTVTTATPGSISIASAGAATQTVTLTGTGAPVPTPTLAANPTSLDFGTAVTVGATSATKTFALTVANLTAGGTIAAAAPFTVSIDNINFSNNITFATGAAPATVYVHFTPTSTTAATGAVLVNSAGATQLSVALTGTGAAASTGGGSSNIATHVVISEVYGGGGNTGSVYTNDFVELYNPTNSAVDMSGWSVQYGSATSTTFVSSNVIQTVFPAGTTIKAHGYFLIQEAAGTGTSTALPTPDLIGAFNMSGTAGKVALVNNSTTLTTGSATDPSIVDFVGYGTTAVNYEGTGPAPAPSNSTSIERKSNVNSTAISMAAGGSDDLKGNGYDSNDNSVDFIIPLVVNPQNSSSPLETPPAGNTTPTLVANPTSLDFGITQTVNTTSVAQTFALTGANLTTGGTITTSAPFTISADGITYSTSLNFTTAAAIPATIYVKFLPTTTTAVTGAVLVTSTGAPQLSVTLTGTGAAVATSATLAANPTSLDFGTTQAIGTSTAAKSFALTGSNLTAGGTITSAAPFTISTDNITFSNSITFATAATIPATVYVRFNPTTITAATGSVFVNSTGAPQLTVALTGKGTNSALSALTISSGVLNPVFLPTSLSYTVAVANNVTSVTVTPTVSDPSETVKVSNVAVLSGTASGSQFLNVGANTIAVKATAVDGVTATTYNIVVTRAAATGNKLSGLTVSTGSLSPSFDQNIFAYNSTTVSNSTTSLTVIPTTADQTSTVTVNGTAVVSGATSAAINLNVGNNTITVVVTAQDGVSKQTYTVVVERAVSTDAVFATNILTPNGDGKNDFWVVKDIQLYPGNTVLVYDRSGRTIYATTNYNNDWGGTLNGAPLAEGTYYYLVNLGPNQRQLKGFITIVRDRR